jgi:hypothetical protein
MVINSILNASSTSFIGNFQRAERRLQQLLLLNLNPSSQTNFIILALWTSRDQTSLDFLSRSQLVVDECATHHSTTKTPQMLPQHYYVISLKSWTETKNIASSCDRLKPHSILLFQNP